MQYADLASWLKFIESIHAQPIDMGLERVQKVWERLQLQFQCPIVTVGGTNGKGSTCIFMESMLRAGGYRTATYLSPHIHHFNERCRLQGEPIDDALLCEAFAVIERIREDISLTYFEFTSLAIFYVFAQQQPLDAVILEVGLGGRLDATNALDSDCAVITTVDLDHQAYLGETREAIGFEKAGILRKHKPVILGDAEAPVTLLQYAKHIEADVWQYKKDFVWNIHEAPLSRQWRYQGRSQVRNALAFPNLVGIKQIHNAACALAALEALQTRLPLAAGAVRKGLAMASLAGRFQIFSGQPVVIHDVAHNPQAAEVLRQNLDAHGYFSVTRAVFGMMADKDIVTVVKTLAPLISHWYLCDLSIARAEKAQTLKQLLIEAGVVPSQIVGCFTHAAIAMQHAQSDSALTDRIIAFGSFHVLSELDI